MEIEWVDEPPPATGKQREYAIFAQALREHPGKWAILPGVKRGGYSPQINRGKFAAFRPAGHFESVTRRPLDSNEPSTYVRYVGAPTEPEAPSSDTTEALQRLAQGERSARLSRGESGNS